MKAEREKSQSGNPPTQAVTVRFGRVAQRLMNALPLGIVVFDRDMNITTMNDAARNMLVDAHNLAGALDGGAVRAKPRPEQPDWNTRLRQTLDRNEVQIFENISYARDGATRVLHLICTPFTDEKTRRTAGILMIEDVTGKVMMENDLALAERLAAMGRLSARVAHELNNPLDGILRYINLALRVAEKSDQPQGRSYLLEARKGLQRMVRIISELLEFSRSTYSAFESADINKIVEEAVRAMESQNTDHRVRIERAYSPDMPNIRSGNLFQVFCNLVKNALDAMEDGGTLTITTFCDDHHAAIEFADTGPGLSPEVREKLFEPFFTTKESGKGTGLGLPICQDIIERYHGTLQAQNQPQGGACFSVRLPLERTSFAPGADRPGRSEGDLD